jgi:hypothetical protein
MQPSSYLLLGLREQFQYYADGRLQQMTDLDDRGQDYGYPDMARHFSRVHSYDHVGRLVSATGTPSQVSSLPYNQSYGYDAFGNATSRYGAYYYQNYSSDGGTYQNNRRQDLTYAADGHVTHTPSYNNMGSVVSFRDWTYDAAGEMTQVKETITVNNSVSTYISNPDGDGQPTIEYYQENLASKTFMVRSSVLGGKVLTRLDNAGNKSSTVFGVDGLLMAVQNVSPYGSSVRWTHIDPLGLSEAGDTKSVYDPMGNHIEWQHAPTGPPPNAYPPSAASFGGLGSSFGSAQDKSCTFNGLPIFCTELAHQVDIGNVSAEFLTGGRRFETEVTSSGLGVINVWVPTPGPKRGPAGPGIDSDGVIRVNHDQDGAGHYETFLLAVNADPQNTSGKRQMTPEEVAQIRTALQNLLQGKCKELMEAMLKNIQGGVFKPNLLDLLNHIEKTHRLFRDDTLGYTGGYGGGNGVDEKPVAANLTINFQHPAGFLWTAVEELTHANGQAGVLSISHENMAQAAITAAQTVGVSLDKLKNTNTPTAVVQDLTGLEGKAWLKADFYNSTLFRNVLQQGCH